MKTSALLVVFLSTHGLVAGEGYDYDHQEAWRGSCNRNNNRQSPINIPTLTTKCDSKLPELLFTNWDGAHDGVFENNGYNVQFNPSNPGQAKTYNHRGTYLLQQFHMHWGRQANEGSEHLFNGHASELEIHFVHTREGGRITDEDYYTVIGVLAEVDQSLPLSEPWSQLNATAVQTYKSSTPVRWFRFDQLLPARKDYYYYQGSLTTPPCNETVSWFVMKDGIRVPHVFLESLRRVQGAEGHALEYNFRKPQSLGNRTVETSSLHPHSMLFE